MFTLHDSGKREEFATGAKRDTAEGKPDFTYFDYYVLSRWAAHYERGAKKYTRNNWKKGIPSSRYMQSLLRHAYQYLAGEREEDHLSAILFNAGGIIYNEEMTKRGRLPKEIHDLPEKEG